MQDNPADELFNTACDRWKYLADFIDNHNDVSDYVLKSVKLEFDCKQDACKLDFNTLYKKRFTEFATASYTIIKEHLRICPNSRVFFKIPSEEEVMLNAKKTGRLDAYLDRKWYFDAENNLDNYIASISELVVEMGCEEEWRVHTYVEELIVRRIVGMHNDNQAYHIKKRVIEHHYKSYPDVFIYLQIEKIFPNGPFNYSIFEKTGEESVKKGEMSFENESSLDDFVREQKEESDKKNLTEGDDEKS